jgi:hypothetical protein
MENKASCVQNFALWVVNGLVPVLGDHGEIIVVNNSLYFNPKNKKVGKRISVISDGPLIEDIPDDVFVGEEYTDETMDILIFENLKKVYSSAMENFKFGLDKDNEIGDIDCYMPDKKLWIEFTTSKPNNLKDHFTRKIGQFFIGVELKNSIKLFRKIVQENNNKSDFLDNNDYNNYEEREWNIEKMLYISLFKIPGISEDFKKNLNNIKIFMFNVLERELNKDDIAIDLKKLFSKSENFQEKISKRWEELLNLIDKL